MVHVSESGRHVPVWTFVDFAIQPNPYQERKQGNEKTKVLKQRFGLLCLQLGLKVAPDSVHSRTVSGDVNVAKLWSVSECKWFDVRYELLEGSKGSSARRVV